jgi:hypothetical protein
MTRRTAALLSYDDAARILADHSMECRPSFWSDSIDALAHFVDANGNSYSEWESVTRTVPAIRDWLEY